MMGEEFANRVNEYLKEKGEETHGVGVIQSNPDQSKHLETATMRVHGAWLDLVNLRRELLGGEPHPEAEFGSATDDAFRRDLTINSLFYNINLKCVEDFTGKGLEDLRAGVVRTPLSPAPRFSTTRFASSARCDSHPDSVSLSTTPSSTPPRTRRCRRNSPPR